MFRGNILMIFPIFFLNIFQVSAPSTVSPPKLSYRSLLSPKSHRNQSSDSEASEKLFSPRSPSPGKFPTTATTGAGGAANDQAVEKSLHLSFTTTAMEDTSHQRSPTLFSDRDSETALEPVLTSTKRSPNREVPKEARQGETPLSHNNVNFRRGDGRMSPNALERRLRAELNLFDSVGDSLQQITEMDRIRDIVQAQQETVSLAQILKNRQALHQKDLDRMSIEAREKAALAAKEIEVARRNAIEAEVNAKKTIAEVQSHAADNIAKSTKAFSVQQNQATALSLDAIRESEKVRRDAFEEYKKTVDDRLSNVGGLMSAAVSAASTAAVEAALKEHREKLELLKKESLNKVSKSYTSTFTGDDSSTNNSSSSSTTSSSRTATGTRSAVTKSVGDHQSSSNPEDFTGDGGVDQSTSKRSHQSSIHTESGVSAAGNTRSKTLTPSSTSKPSEIISERLSVADGDGSRSASGDDISEHISDDVNDVGEDKELTDALFSTGHKASGKYKMFSSNVQIKVFFTKMNNFDSW